MADAPKQLKRELGVFGATLLGLGSILGTGVFVSLGIAAGIAGPAVLIAIVLAGFVALCNALSSAQLAAAHPVAGGTYEYGYKYLHPLAGFTAGWMFMVAKSASAATAALGFVGYVALPMLSEPYSEPPVWASVVLVSIITAVVLSGIRRANWLNLALLSFAIGALVVFCVVGAGSIAATNLDPFWPPSGEQLRRLREVFHIDLPRFPLMTATALMFVAYTGYGRIATLGEEVHEPKRTIPRAILVTLAVSLAIYVGVAFVAVGTVGSQTFGRLTVDGAAAPLERIAQSWGSTSVARLIVIGAIAAMGGVLLNLILGLSRVLLAMARRRDVPHKLSEINKAGTTPTAAVIVVGVIIAALVLIGDVKATWSLSAFTVLIYYGITNAAALRLPPENRLYPRVFSWLGLGACASLAVCVDFDSILIGGSILLVGFVWYAAARKLRKPDATNP